MTSILSRRTGPIGFGLMHLTPHGGATIPDERAFSVLQAALNTGCTSWNAGEFYGPSHANSLALLSRYFTAHPDDSSRVELNVKGAFDASTMKPTGSHSAVSASIDRCVAQLGGRKLEMFELGRRDVDVPLREGLEAIAAKVKEGKVGGAALTEVNAATIREAAEITPIVAVEVELSLWVREPLSNGITDACRDLDIPIFAYCPLGHGMLTNQMKSVEDAPGMLRSRFPRFQDANFDTNLKLVHALAAFAKDKKRCTASQLAISWLLALSKRPDMPTIIPIPGTTNPDHVVENATAVDLSTEDMAEIDDILKHHEVVGTRYPEPLMKLTDM